jgi:hypothetical protein
VSFPQGKVRCSHTRIALQVMAFMRIDRLLGGYMPGGMFDFGQRKSDLGGYRFLFRSPGHLKTMDALPLNVKSYWDIDL